MALSCIFFFSLKVKLITPNHNELYILDVHIYRIYIRYSLYVCVCNRDRRGVNSCNLMSAEDREGMVINLEKYQVEPGTR